MLCLQRSPAADVVLIAMLGEDRSGALGWVELARKRAASPVTLSPSPGLRYGLLHPEDTEPKNAAPQIEAASAPRKQVKACKDVEDVLTTSTASKKSNAGRVEKKQRASAQDSRAKKRKAAALAYTGKRVSKPSPAEQRRKKSTVYRTSAHADHFLAVLREVEAAQGRSWKAKTRVSGLVEVDGTSLGKFAARASCKRFQPQIKALTAKLARAGKVIPKVFFAHYQVLGVMRRGGPPVLAIPDLPVTVRGSRPPSESLEGIRQTGLLHKVPLAQRPSTTIFSDGNRAWQTLAQQLRMTSHAVCHQNKEWTRSVRAERRPWIERGNP
ncbi:unnamed protein product [Symbiodinium microadriaticum]|nr:unnamed protein product [Symbiodinium microadriaticum]